MIMRELYDSGRLDIEPTGIASVDIDKDRLIGLWGNKSPNKTTEHFQIIPIKWLTNEEARKKDMEKYKEENKVKLRIKKEIC